MIQHETYRFDQCKVIFDKDIYAAKLLPREGKEKRYPTLLFDNRPINEGGVDLKTIPCILEFKNKAAIDLFISELNELKELWDV